MVTRSLGVLSVWLVLLAGVSLAQDGAPPPVAPPPAPGQDAREAHLAALRATVVHFDFRRAPLADVLAALERASGVPVRIGDAGRRALERRRFKMRYVADRTGLQVLEDLAKAAALDAEVTAEGAVLDTPGQVRRLRERLGLPAKPVRAAADDVARMLETKRLTLQARERALDLVLDFLRDETGVRFVVLADDADASDAEAPRLTVQVTDEPLKTVLDLLLEPVGWAWLRQGSVVLVGPADVIARAAAVEEAEAAPAASPPAAGR
jgi:hypothetical protein